MSFNRKYDSIAITAEELTDSLESGCEEINASVREGIEQMVRHGLDNEKLPISETLEQAASIALMLLAEETRLAEMAAANDSSKTESDASAPETSEPSAIAASDAAVNESDTALPAESQDCANVQESESIAQPEQNICMTDSENKEQTVITKIESSEPQQESTPSEKSLLSKLQSEKFYELANRVADAYDHAKSGLEIIASARNYRIALLACAYDGFDSRGLPLDIIRAFIFEIENCALAVRDNAINPECARLAMTLLELVDELTDTYTASQKTFLTAFANEFPGLEASIAFKNGSKPKPQDRKEKSKKEKPNPWGETEPNPWGEAETKHHKDPWAEAESKTHETEECRCQLNDDNTDKFAESADVCEDANVQSQEEFVNQESTEIAEVPQFEESSVSAQEEQKPQKERKKRTASQGEKRTRKPRVQRNKEIENSEHAQEADDVQQVSDIETIPASEEAQSDVQDLEEKPKRQRRTAAKKSSADKSSQQIDTAELTGAAAESEQSEKVSAAEPPADEI